MPDGYHETISISKISWLVKQVIAKRSNVPVQTVRHAHSLQKRYGYTDAGKMDLAPDLNAKFDKEGHPIIPLLEPTETVEAKTVGNLVILVRSRFPGAK